MGKIIASQQAEMKNLVENMNTLASDQNTKFNALELFFVQEQEKNLKKIFLHFEKLLQIQNDKFDSKLDQIIASQQNSLTTVQDDLKSFKNIVTTKTTAIQENINNLTEQQDAAFDSVENKLTGIGYLSQKLNNKFVTFEQKLNETLLTKEKLGTVPKIHENKLNSLEVQNTEQTTKLRVVERMLDNLLQTQNNRFLGLENILFSSQKISENLGNYTKMQNENLNSKFDQMNKSQQEIDAKLINQLNTYKEEVKNCSELEKNKSNQLKSGLSILLTQVRLNTRH
jgi:hypothetical protein